MNKTKIFICILISFICVKNVNAYNYIDVNNYDFNQESVQHSVSVEDDNIFLQNVYEDRDGNILMIVTYNESDSKWASNNHQIPTANGQSNPERKHVKLVKMDKDFNKMWETNYFEVGNWENADPSAPTVSSSFSEVTQLSDGSYLAVGQIFGLSRNAGVFVRDDDLDAVSVRFDKDGNIIFKKLYYNQGVDNAISVKALQSGGYIIKYYVVPTKTQYGKDYKKPEDFEIDGEMSYYYVVYNNDNEIVHSFSDEQDAQLDNYDFYDVNDKYDIKNVKTVTDETTGYGVGKGKFYQGVTINNNVVYVEDNFGATDAVSLNKYYIVGYDANSFTQKYKTPNLAVKNDRKFSLQGVLLTNDGGFIVNGYVYDAEGNNISKFDHNKSLNFYADPLSDGRIISYPSNKSYDEAIKFGVLSPLEESDDFAKFIINGKEVRQRLNAFLENDRTYISLNNLCNVMNCTFKKSDKANNRLIIEFDIFDNDNNKMIKSADSANALLGKRLKYVIVHDIGSKSYTTYLSHQPLRIYKLNSPYYDEKTVDVASMERDGQIYVPLRFISEALGRYVEYIPKGENDEKPTIKIGAYGEGDFYEKYALTMSYSNLNDGDIISDKNDSNYIELERGGTNYMYGYAYIKAENKVVSKDRTLLVYTIDKIGGGADIEYNGRDDSSILDSYIEGSFEVSRNGIKERKNVLEYADGTQVPWNPAYTSYLLISNIEGYPFIKIINFK